MGEDYERLYQSGYPHSAISAGIVLCNFRYEVALLRFAHPEDRTGRRILKCHYRKYSPREISLNIQIRHRPEAGIIALFTRSNPR
jgi:hypothetical protein